MASLKSFTFSHPENMFKTGIISGLLSSKWRESAWNEWKTPILYNKNLLLNFLHKKNSGDLS